MAFHFPVEETLKSILLGVMDAAGDNFTPPFDSESQPVDGSAINMDPFAYIQLPAGASLQSVANPGAISSISDGINSVIAALAPFTSAYMMLMPIFGIIKGIIEVICALMNPFAVIRAVIKLFTKYIIPFIALFPPFAGLLLLIAILKIILAIVLFIITVVIPIICLIRDNIKELANFIKNAADNSSNLVQSGTSVVGALSSSFSGDFTMDKLNGVKKKALWLLEELIKQCAIIEVIQPILEMVLQILAIRIGIPCKKRKNKSDDSDCCEEDVCPEVFSNPPSGQGRLLISKFGHTKRNVFKIITGNERIRLLEQYQSNLEEKLNSQLDEPVQTSNSAPGIGNKTAFNVRIKSTRGKSNEIVLPVLDINGTTIKVKSKVMRSFLGPKKRTIGSGIFSKPKISYEISYVNYAIEPNWDYLLRENIVGIGCHPEVAVAKEMFDPDMTPPNTDGILSEYIDVNTGLKTLESQLGQEIDKTFLDIESATNIDDLDTTISTSAISNNLASMSSTQNEMISLMLQTADSMKNRLNTLLKSAVNSSTSTVLVDKNSAKADVKDKIIITVTPKDVSGAPIAKNLPSDIQLEIGVFTTFGILSNKTVNTSTGTVTVELTSPNPGSAIITARINDTFISDSVNGILAPRNITVSFVADAILPARRKQSKTSGSGMDSEHDSRK